MKVLSKWDKENIREIAKELGTTELVLTRKFLGMVMDDKDGCKESISWVKEGVWGFIEGGL
jgi:hypothetical protein